MWRSCPKRIEKWFEINRVEQRHFKLQWLDNLHITCVPRSVVFIAAAFDSFLRREDERRNGERNRAWVFVLVQHSERVTRRNLIAQLTVAQWWMAKGLASIGTGGKKLTFALFLLKRLVVLWLFYFCANFKSYRMTIKLNICPSSPAWMEIESVYSLHERRETFFWDFWVRKWRNFTGNVWFFCNHKAKKKSWKKCQISLPKGHSTISVRSASPQITFMRDFFPRHECIQKPDWPQWRWQGDNSINNVWHFFTNLINSCCSQMGILQSA